MPVALLKGSLGRIIVVDELIKPVDSIIGLDFCPINVLWTCRFDSTAELSTRWSSIVAIAIIRIVAVVGGTAAPGEGRNLAKLASLGFELTRNIFEQGGEKKKKNGRPDQRNRRHYDPRERQADKGIVNP